MVSLPCSTSTFSSPEFGGVVGGLGFDHDDEEVVESPLMEVDADDDDLFAPTSESLR